MKKNRSSQDMVEHLKWTTKYPKMVSIKKQHAIFFSFVADTAMARIFMQNIMNNYRTVVKK